MSAHSFPWGELSSRIHFFPLSFAKSGWGEKLGIPCEPPRSLSCLTRSLGQGTVHHGLGRARKTPSPSRTISRSCLSPKGCCPSSRRVGTSTAPSWPASAPGRGEQEPSASSKGSSVSRAGAALSPAGAAGFISPKVLLQLYLPRNPAPGFPIHLAHPGPPQSAADLPQERSLE